MHQSQTVIDTVGVCLVFDRGEGGKMMGYMAMVGHGGAGMSRWV